MFFLSSSIKAIRIQLLFSYAGQVLSIFFSDICFCHELLFVTYKNNFKCSVVKADLKHTDFNPQIVKCQVPPRVILSIVLRKAEALDLGGIWARVSREHANSLTVSVRHNHLYTS